MALFDGSVKKINILNNLDRSSVCLTAVIFLPAIVGGVGVCLDVLFRVLANLVSYPTSHACSKYFTALLETYLGNVPSTPQPIWEEWFFCQTEKKVALYIFEYYPHASVRSTKLMCFRETGHPRFCFRGLRAISNQ